MKHKNTFIITSHGWSASNWLAHSLNLHKDIVCTHSARNEWASDKELQSNLNLKKNLNQLHKGYVLRQEQGFNDSYNYIISLSESKFYGSVHLYRLRDIPIVDEKFGKPDYNFNVVNLVRNPIDLVWSGYGQFKDLFRYDINELHWTLGKVLRTGKEFVFDLGKKYDLMLGDYEILAFICASCILGSLRLDIDAQTKIKQIPYINYKGIVKMETITSDPKEMKLLLKLLSDVEIECYDEFLNEVYNMGLINKHRHDSKKLSPKERFESFNDWQKEVFMYYMNLYSLVESYSNMGYDLSFLSK